MAPVDRAELDHYLSAAVVFGRSAFHYLETAAKTSGNRPYSKWFGAKAISIKSDLLLDHFKERRNTEIHVRRVPLSRHVSLTASATLSFDVYAEARVIRGRPWYQRSLSVLWQDTRDSVLRPIKRWRHRAGISWRRGRARVASMVEQFRARFRRPAPLSVDEFFLDDPEGLNRPAVVLVDAYLTRLEAIVAEAEAKHPDVFA